MYFHFEHVDQIVKHVKLRKTWAEENFDFHDYQKILGSGKFGTIHEATLKETGEKYAVKMMFISNETVRSNLLQELQNQSNANHPNIVQIFSAYVTPKQVCLVLEHVSSQ